jgi:hypothetical protein
MMTATVTETQAGMWTRVEITAGSREELDDAMGKYESRYAPHVYCLHWRRVDVAAGNWSVSGERANHT